MDSSYFEKELGKDITYLEAIKKDLQQEILSLKQELDTRRNEINILINGETEAANRKLTSAVGNIENLRKMESDYGSVKRLDKRLVRMKEELNKDVSSVNAALEAHVAINKSYFLPDAQQEEFYITQRPAFLESYMETGNIVAACKRVPGLKAPTVLYYKKKDAQFQEDINIAYDMFKDKIDAEITDRALNGQMEALSYQGEPTSEIRKFDNRLLERAAAAHCPEKYDRARLDRIPDANKPVLNLNIINFNDSPELEQDLQKSIGLVHEITEAGAVVKNVPTEVVIDVEVTT